MRNAYALDDDKTSGEKLFYTWESKHKPTNDKLIELNMQNDKRLTLSESILSSQYEFGFSVTSTNNPEKFSQFVSNSFIPVSCR